jgi:hypothetical protein
MSKGLKTTTQAVLLVLICAMVLRPLVVFVSNSSFYSETLASSQTLSNPNHSQPAGPTQLLPASPFLKSLAKQAPPEVVWIPKISKVKICAGSDLRPDISLGLFGQSPRNFLVLRI